MVMYGLQGNTSIDTALDGYSLVYVAYMAISSYTQLIINISGINTVILPLRTMQILISRCLFKMLLGHCTVCAIALRNSPERRNSIHSPSRPKQRRL